MVETSIQQPIVGSQGLQGTTFKDRSDLLSSTSAQPPLSSDLNAFHPPPIQPLQSDVIITEDANARVIKEKPVLERVEKFQRTDVHKKVHIAEKHIQDIVEVREIPIQKRFVHPVQQMTVQDESLFEVEGKDVAEREIERMLQELRDRDMHHQVEVQQHNEVFVHNHEPTRQLSRETVMHYIISKPVITEIHEQPIEEVHEQTIQRVIYEKPILRIIRSDNITSEVEQLQKSVDLSGFVPSSTTSSLHGSGLQDFSQQQSFQKPIIAQSQPLSSTIPSSPLQQQPLLNRANSPFQQQQLQTGTLSSASPLAQPSLTGTTFDQNPFGQTSSSLPVSSGLSGEPSLIPTTSSESTIPVVSEKLPYQESSTMQQPVLTEGTYTKQSGVPKMGFGERVTQELGKALTGKKKKNKNKGQIQQL